MLRGPSCTKGSVIELRVRINGEERTFRRGGRCEARSWAAADRDVPLSDALEFPRGT